LVWLIFGSGLKVGKKIIPLTDAELYREEMEYERDKADERHGRKKQFRIKDYWETESLKKFKSKRINDG
jgi:hypothetical protein